MKRSSGWWSFGFPLFGMIGWGCGTSLVQIGFAGWSGGSAHVPQPILGLLVGFVVFFGCIGLLFAAVTSAGAGLVREFMRNAPWRKCGAVAVLCSLVFLAPIELSVFFHGLPMGDGPVNNFGLGFNLRLPWASPYAHALIVGVGAWFGACAVRPRETA